MNNMIVLAAVAGIGFVLLSGGLYMLVRLNRLSSQIDSIRDELNSDKGESERAELFSRINLLKNEVKELRVGFIAINKKNQSIEQQVGQLETTQSTMQPTDDAARLYSRAVKMVELGADVEEIVRECELPKAEAELLVSLHRK